MNARRAALGALGVVALAVAQSATGDGAFAGLVSAAVSALGNDYLFVASVGGASIVVAAAMLYSGRSANLTQATMPDPERPTAVPAAGDGFDERVESLRFALPVVGRRERERVRERLRTAAVEATVRSAGCSRGEAERRVASGAWTDDDDAAAFLSSTDSPASPERRLRLFAAGDTLGRRRVRRTVEEICERTPGGGAHR